MGDDKEVKWSRCLRSILNTESTKQVRVTSAESAELRHPRSQALADFVKDLLNLLKSVAVQDALPQSQGFSAQLDEYAATVAKESNIYRLDILRGKCLKTSDEFFEQWRQHLGDREQELRDVIDLLMSAVQTFSKDNTSFHDEVSASNQRMQTCCDLDDIRELKVRLTREVTQLQTTISEKQQRDAAQFDALSTHVTTLQSKLEEVEQKAQTDGQELTEKAESFVLIMLDIDDFKQINDQHGHQVGDRALISVAVKLREAIRTSDFIARYGGEEFALIQLGSRLEHSLPAPLPFPPGCGRHAVRIHRRWRGTRTRLHSQRGLKRARFTATRPEALIARADAALYEAKRPRQESRDFSQEVTNN